MNPEQSALPRAFLCRRFPASVEAGIHGRYHLTVNADDSILTSAAIAERAKGAEVLFVSATERIDAGVIAALSPTLRAIATLSVGHDHIDLAAARIHGIKVLHTPDVLSDACAEIAMMLVLNACRRGREGDTMVRSGEWQGWAPTQLLGKGLVGARLGIFGMGRIGRSIARRAKAFDMQVHYHNRSRLSDTLEDGAIYHATLDAMLAVSDVFVVAAPGTPESRGLMNAARIARLPKGGILVNISRGEIVDDNALIDALTSGHLMAAGLDVFANEPQVEPRYRALPNVFMTPHIGSATHETRHAMGQMLLDGLAALAAGQTPSNIVV
jgi:glyoxylate reductase